MLLSQSHLDMALAAARERHLPPRPGKGKPVAPSAASKALAELDDLGRTMQRLLEECKDSAATRLQHNNLTRAGRQRKSLSAAMRALHKSILTHLNRPPHAQLLTSMLCIAILATSTSSRLRLSSCPRQIRLSTAVRPGNFAARLHAG